MTLFFAVTVLFCMAANFVHPVTPTLFKDLKLGNYMFGYALAALQAMNFLFSPLWGRLNSVISIRTSLLISCLGYAVGQVFFAMTKSETGFIFARAFAGIFSGGIFVSTINYPIRMAKDAQTRGTWLALYATIQSVGGAFGFFAGGMLGTLNIYYSIIAQIVCLTLCGVFFYFICKEDGQEKEQISLSKLAKEVNPFSAFAASKKFMTLTLSMLFTMCALQALGQIGFDQSFNYYIKDQFNFSPAYNGILKAAMGIVTLIANSTVCIYLLRKTDIRRSVTGVFALCTATMMVIINLGSVVPFLVVNVLFYAFSAICIPLLQDIVADHAKSGDSNLVMGFYNSIKSFGSIIGALAAGTLYAIDPIYPFICSMLAFLVGTIAAALFYLRSKAANNQSLTAPTE